MLNKLRHISILRIFFWLISKVPVMISLLLLVVAVFLKIQQFSFIVTLQNKVFDTYQQQFPREYTDAGVTIIDIDDESLNRLGQWPWPRPIMAEMVYRLITMNAGPIAFDIVFAEPDRTSPISIAEVWHAYPDLTKELFKLPDHDQMLVDAFASGYIVTGYAFSPIENERNPAKKFGYTYSGYPEDTPSDYINNYRGVTLNLPGLEEAAEGNGFFSTVRDPDGIIRRIPLLAGFQNEPYFSLSMEALRVGQQASSYHVSMAGSGGSESVMADRGITHIRNGDFTIPTDSEGNFLVYFTERTEDRYIPAWEIMEDGFDSSRIEGRILFFGTSAAGLQDLRATPLDPYLPGVELHVQAVEQILLDEFLYRPGFLLIFEIAGMIVGGLVLMIIMARLTAVWGALFMVTAQVAAFSGSVYAFVEYGYLIEPVSPSIVILILYLSESLRRYMLSESERKQVRGAFAQYMSPALVEELAKNPEALTLGGEMRDMTMLFADIRGFTTISEQFDAQGLTEFINAFLTPMTEVILQRQGTIDKYMGDCIMAFWNAPLAVREHPKQACLSALEMFAAVAKMNVIRKKQAAEDGTTYLPINIGIGVNTGEVCVGNMGSDQRFDYSVLGDDVNLASRLEGQSKTYGVGVVIGPKTQNQVIELATIELDLIKVKGKTEAVRIFALLGGEELADSDAFLKFKDLWKKTLAVYRNQGWDEADNFIGLCETALEKVEGLELDVLFELYRERIRAYRLNSPGPDWDGVFEATTK